jgi:hypothetical protein
VTGRGGGASLPLAARGESLASHRDGRGAPPARRDDREYREYLSEEQRRWRGCIARRMQPDFHHGLLDSGASSCAGCQPLNACDSHAQSARSATVRRSRRGASDSGPPLDAGARGSRGAKPCATERLTKARGPAKQRRRPLRWQFKPARVLWRGPKGKKRRAAVLEAHHTSGSAEPWSPPAFLSQSRSCPFGVPARRNSQPSRLIVSVSEPRLLPAR